ncbi:SPW repeat protein [Actinopolymorpha alba]|uniref:SPW repeat protein n=1 Tax=Actinopolymorpha alba TaxID=533267 RepID=UPI00037E89BC|nr:SPW repeat protein [Actinopolymorpha alba]
MDTKKWVRWQDWVAVVAGVVLLLTPLWFGTGMARVTWTMIVLGALLAATGLWSLARPGAIASEWIHAILGVLAFVSPWVMGFASHAGAAWTSWIVGVVAAVTGLWTVQHYVHSHRKATVT